MALDWMHMRYCSGVNLVSTALPHARGGKDQEPESESQSGHCVSIFDTDEHLLHSQPFTSMSNPPARSKLILLNSCLAEHSRILIRLNILLQNEMTCTI